MSALRAPLARVPENNLKFVVGVMLTSFGVFWGGEGVHAHWPGGDAALLVVIPVVLLFALAQRRTLLRRALAAAPSRAPPGTPRRCTHEPRAVRYCSFLWDFVIGDDWRIAAAVAVTLVAMLVLSNNGAAVWWLLPIVVLVMLGVSVWGVARSHR